MQQTSSIRKHLFILSPNNSGSTLLRKLLEQSQYSWYLEREGQHVPGFAGPSSRSTGARLLWASRQEWIDQFSNSSNYDWPSIKRLWLSQSQPGSDQASVLVTSSPPFLLLMDTLKREFQPAYFLILVRNPYAVVEGIYRRREQQPVLESLCYVAAAKHIIRCLALQQANLEQVNLEQSNKRCLFIRYEDLCSQPNRTAQRISELVPDLSDLDFGTNVSVKGVKPMGIENKNPEQMARIDAEGYEQINRVFSRNLDLLEYFGYQIEDGKKGTAM